MREKILVDVLLMGTLPKEFHEEFRALPENCRQSQLEDLPPEAEPQQTMQGIESYLEGASASLLVLVCVNGSGYEVTLDEIAARCSQRGKEVHLVVPLPFGFERHHVAIQPGMLERSLFHARTLVALDGRSLLARSPEHVTLQDLFRIQAVKLTHLVQDLLFVLTSSQGNAFQEDFSGVLLWESTWHSPRASEEHLSTLLRLHDASSTRILVGHALECPDRLVRLQKRLGLSAQLLENRNANEQRLGGFVSTSLDALL